jgi:hypothetical protein
MKFQPDQYVIVLFGAVIALALFLFPEWIAVHPSNGLTVPLGYGWIFSPPAAPENFTGMHVERNWFDNLFLAFVALTVGAALIAFGPRKVKPE